MDSTEGKPGRPTRLSKIDLLSSSVTVKAIADTEAGFGA
jgi:hypothetical protein